MASSSGEKTEKATPQKLRKARRDGSIGHSPEVGSWLSLLVASFVIPKVATSLMSNSQATMIQISGLIRRPDTGPALAIARVALLNGAKAVAPLILLILVTSVLSSVGQGGLHIAPKALAPKFSRLNPINGVKRMFGPQGLWQLAKSLLKMAVLAGVTYLTVRPLATALVASGSMSVGSIVTQTINTALKLTRFGAAAGLMMSFADVAVVRRRNNKQLKMTKHEVKEEHKGSEGDPQLKSARRSRALEMSRNRMMADVMTADVVVVNPTHFAVALKYEPKKGAPRVVAKGGDFLALQIRQIAEDHRVPVVQDVPLARTLYASCKVGTEIPADLYHGVAAVLAFVMRLKKRGAVVGVQKMVSY